MSDPLLPAMSGISPFLRNRRTVSATLDAVRAYQRISRGMLGGDGPDTLFDSSLLAKVKNGTGADLDAFSVLAYDDVIDDPSDADSRHDAQRGFAFVGDTPASETAPFVVTVEGIENDTVGSAVVSGLVVVQVEVSDAAHRAAKPISGTNTKLASGASGVPIIWKEAGTGTKWAVVLLGASVGGGGGPFAANLTEATGAASWQSRTLSGGSWTDGSTTGTDNAYPVQCGGSAFTPGATSTSIMWEEPAGSGMYAFLPIQYASTAVPGFVSTAAQSIAGVKTFTDKILCSAIANSAFTVGIQTPGILLSSPGGTPGTTKGVITWNSSYGGSNGVVDIQSGPVGINVPTAYYVGGTVGGTATVDGMVFQGGLYISGSPPPPPPPPPPGVTSIGISSTGGSISVTGSPVTGSGTINVETSGASGTDPDAGVFSNGRCTTISTLGGVDTTWTVAVGDTVVISKGRIQSITPGS